MLQGVAQGQTDALQREGMGLANKRAEQDIEMNTYRNQIAKNEAEIANLIQSAKTKGAQQQVLNQVAKIEDDNYKQVYSVWKTRGGHAAASLFNEMRGNGVKDASDLVVYQDPKTKKQMLKVINANGETVADPDNGPAVFDLKAIEERYGFREDKGTFKDIGKGAGILNTRTGRVGPGLSKDQLAAGEDSPTDAAKRYKELRALGVPDEVARATAYGTFKTLKDQFGVENAIVDVTTNNVIGTLENVGGKPTWKPSPLYEKAGSQKLDQKQAETTARREAAERRPTLGGMRPEATREAFGGVSEEEWIKNRVNQLTGGSSQPAAGAVRTNVVQSPPVPKDMSRQQILDAAKKSAGTSTPEQKKLIRERMKGWKFTDQELSGIGL